MNLDDEYNDLDDMDDNFEQEVLGDGERKLLKVTIDTRLVALYPANI